MSHIYCAILIYENENQKLLWLDFNIIFSRLLHGDKLIYGGWIPHLCFNTEITILKNQPSSKFEYLKFKIVNFRK